MELWTRIDPKLKYTLITGIIAWVVAKYAVDLDTDLSAALTGIVASLVGYQVPNDGTILREDHDDGNAEPPDEDDE